MMIEFFLMYFSINRLSVENVKSLMDIIKSCGVDTVQSVEPNKVSELYNRALVFEPGKRENAAFAACFALRDTEHESSLI